MLFQINIFFPKIIILYQLFTLTLLLLEIFLYPGIVQKYFHINTALLLLFSAILIFWQKYLLPSYINKFILFSTVLLIPICVYLNIQEQIHFSNYIYARFRVLPSSAQELLFFLLLQSMAIVAQKDSLIKKISGLKTHSFFKNKKIILLLFSIIFSSLLLRHNINAKWSIIDDHEIAYFLGSDKKITLSEFPKIISKTEAGNFGNSVRFRPSYYLLRITEASMWKDNPQLWYIARFVILALFLFSVSYITSSYYGAIPAMIFCLYVMTGSYWADIWTRLGPAEIYVALGISLYLLGLIEIVGKNTKSTIPWFLFLIGGLIAIGSKENMVILVLPSLYVIIDKFAQHKLNWKLIFPISLILYALFIATGVILAISKAGTDIYSNEISTKGLFSLVIPSILRTIRDLRVIEILLGGAVILLPTFTVFKNISLLRFVNTQIKSFILLAFLFLTYFSQFIFYSNVWPTSVRYDFPGILAKQLFWLVSLYLLSKIFQVFFGQKSKSKIIILYTIFFGLLLMFTINHGYHSLIKASKTNTTKTEIFTNDLLSISQIVKGHSDYPLIFSSNNPWDYEPIFSLERYVRFMGITNPIVLDYMDNNYTNRKGLEKDLSLDLIKISKNGSSQFGSNYSINRTNCILILLPGAKNADACVLSVRIN